MASCTFLLRQKDAMLIKITRGWEIPAREATPEGVWRNRRSFLTGAAAATLAGLGSMWSPWKEAKAASRASDGAAQRPLLAPRNSQYTTDRPISSERVATHFNNYYEFTELKDHVRRLAEAFQSRPWQIEVKGLIEKPRKIDVDDLIRRMPLEERVYRHRCVERWVVIVPWVGFPMKKFVEWAAPRSQARYVRLVSFFRPSQAAGQRTATWYPWPYHEALTLEEATNELAFLVVGAYGKTLPSQNGAPLRLHTPWKYGYKSIKAIVRFEFAEKQPPTFWSTAVPNEYDFWANVNPAKPHPRWSQASESVIDTGEVVPTRLYNGYEKYVADLYR